MRPRNQSRRFALAPAFVLAGAVAGSASAAAPDAAAIAANGLPPGVPACQACHGGNGEGNLPAGFPRLAGAGAGYLAGQLAAFASGQRQDPVMQPIAAALSAAQRDALARHYAALAQASTTATAIDPSPTQVGAWLAARGRWTAGLPACAQCHGPHGLGVGDAFPPLAGQPARYLAAQLQAWKHGTRPPGPQSLMAGIAARLSDDDIAAVADYYAGLAAAATSTPAASSAEAAPAPLASGGKSFAPPAERAMPDGEFGEMVKRGEQIFLHTRQNALNYVGNSLDCVNCHIDAGRRANSAPMWGAYVLYPAFRAKDGTVNTFAARLQGCFNYSMNGKAPPLGDPVLVALESYSYWLAKGAPVGSKMAGAGYPKLAPPVLAPDFARGQHVYDAHCALCHGAGGQGQASGGQPAFPPLWGPDSFNWGAGMHQVNNAAGFIKANMPLSQGDTLSDQEAWDVALFVDSHERPQDPRFSGSVEATRKQFHDTPQSMYGRVVDGHVLGGGKK